MGAGLVDPHTIKEGRMNPSAVHDPCVQLASRRAGTAVIL
jgi:hypothetical protein